MRFTRGSPDAATTVRARGRVVVIVLPVLALLVLVIAYWNIDEDSVDGSSGSGSGVDKHRPTARFASLMADARNAYGGLTGTDDETVEPETPSILWSSLEQRESDLGSAWANDKHHNALHTYHVARNVMLERGNVVYVAEEDTEVNVSTLLPLAWGKDKPRFNIRVGVKKATPDTNPLSMCKAWVNKPAINFHFPNHENIFHYLNDALLLVLDTLNDTGLTPPAVARALDAARRRDPSVETCLLPETNNVMLVSAPEAYHFPWRFLFDLISFEHRTPAEVDGMCFKTLIIGTSYEMDFRYKAPSQSAGLRDFQAYAFRAALTQRVQRMPAKPSAVREDFARQECAFLAAAGQLPAPGSWHSGGTLPKVTFAVRPPPSKRAVTNEADIIAAIRERYDVDLVLTKFEGSMYDTMKLMATTDLFMGMHGAGFTNVLYLPQGAAVLQLFPFGWMKENGIPHREEIYSSMISAANCSYTRWNNKRWDHAFLRKEDFGTGEDPREWTEHPVPAMIDPKYEAWLNGIYWANQETYVDMEDFMPALEAAFKMAGIPKRGSTVGAQQANAVTQTE